MEEQQQNKMTLFTKVSIAANTLLFGVTGIIYLAQGNTIIGSVLLAAGVLNIIYILFTVKTKNYAFVGLNFLFTLAAFIVCIDFLTKNNVNTGILWLVVTLYYLITGFILLIRLRKSKTS